jgi:hypothetical protein
MCTYNSPYKTETPRYAIPCSYLCSFSVFLC